MHRRAHESDIIIVNHHLFFADLAVKDEEFGGILPEYAAVVFDEAHELEDVAGQYFGMSVSNHQVADLSKDVAAFSRRKNLGSAELDQLLNNLDSRTEMLFLAFSSVEGRVGFRGHVAFLETHREKYEEVLLAFDMLATRLQMIDGHTDEVGPMLR